MAWASRITPFGPSRYETLGNSTVSFMLQTSRSGSRPCGGMLHALPDALRRRRHVDVLDAERPERLEDRVDHGRRRRDGSGLAHPLDAQRVGLAEHLVEVHLEGRHVVGAGHAVLAE